VVIPSTENLQTTIEENYISRNKPRFLAQGQGQGHGHGQILAIPADNNQTRLKRRYLSDVFELIEFEFAHLYYAPLYNLLFKKPITSCHRDTKLLLLYFQSTGVDKLINVQGVSEKKRKKVLCTVTLRPQVTESRGFHQNVQKLFDNTKKGKV